MKSTRPLVWVTGVRGFIGSHLARVIARTGQDIIGFARPQVNNSIERQTFPIYPLSPDGISAAIDAGRTPSRVYHLAGGATVGESFRNPHGDFVSNVATTEMMLEAIRSLSTKVPFILASSAAVYGSVHSNPISVGDSLVPSSPYGHHKLIAEQLVYAHAEAFGLPATICRLFSIYGPGLRKQLLFDACSQLARASTPPKLILGGSGDERRDWLHVEDAVSGLIELSDPQSGEVRCFNLASGRSTSIREIADLLVRNWGVSAEASFSCQSRPGDPYSLVASLSSLPPQFIPLRSLNEGIFEFVSWFRKSEQVR